MNRVCRCSVSDNCSPFTQRFIWTLKINHWKNPPTKTTAHLDLTDLSIFIPLTSGYTVASRDDRFVPFCPLLISKSFNTIKFSGFGYEFVRGLEAILDDDPLSLLLFLPAITPRKMVCTLDHLSPTFVGIRLPTILTPESYSRIERALNQFREAREPIPRWFIPTRRLLMPLPQAKHGITPPTPTPTPDVPGQLSFGWDADETPASPSPVASSPSASPSPTASPSPASSPTSISAAPHS